MSNSGISSPFRLTLVSEQVEDGTYLATSPTLEGFLVQGDTVEDVIRLAPGVAKALLEAMREKGIAVEAFREKLSFPVKVDLFIE